MTVSSLAFAHALHIYRLRDGIGHKEPSEACSPCSGTSLTFQQVIDLAQVVADEMLASRDTSVPTVNRSSQE